MNTSKIFDPDEMKLGTVDPAWNEDDLLNQTGIFFLKDVAIKLEISAQEFKNHARKLQKEGKSSWEIMGIRKTWTHWQVRMKVFSEFFRGWWHCPKVREVEADWDANLMLAQKGIFQLNEVCRKIPFTPRQIRYQLGKHKETQHTLGVWKDPHLKSYIVNMEVFSQWIKRVWNTGDLTSK